MSIIIDTDDLHTYPKDSLGDILLRGEIDYLYRSLSQTDIGQHLPQEKLEYLVEAIFASYPKRWDTVLVEVEVGVVTGNHPIAIKQFINRSNHTRNRWVFDGVVAHPSTMTMNGGSPFYSQKLPVVSFEWQNKSEDEWLVSVYIITEVGALDP